VRVFLDLVVLCQSRLQVISHPGSEPDSNRCGIENFQVNGWTLRSNGGKKHIFKMIRGEPLGLTVILVSWAILGRSRTKMRIEQNEDGVPTIASLYSTIRSTHLIQASGNRKIVRWCEACRYSAVVLRQMVCNVIFLKFWI
jgi:hypothetical protein